MDIDVSGALPLRSVPAPLVAGSGVVTGFEVAGVLAFEPFVSVAGFFFKTSSTFWPPALMSCPTPCMVLHPAMSVAAAIATILMFITTSWSGLPE